MSAPRTAAGQAMLARIVEANRRWQSVRGFFIPPDVIAIEAEARAQAIAEVRAAVAALPVYRDRSGEPVVGGIDRVDILAALDGLEP